MICAASQDPRSHGTGIFANTRLTQTTHCIGCYLSIREEWNEKGLIRFWVLLVRVILPSNSLSLLSWGQSLIECVQTESDGSDHLEWHSPPPHDGLTTPQATSHVMSTSWQSAANTFFTLWHLQSSSDSCSQLSYIACKLCYELREKKMRPDKVKTITSVMKPLLGRGDNEGIFSRNLVSINHGEPPHSADVLPPSISAHSTRVWSAMLGPLWSLQWSVWPVSYAGHGDQVSPMLRCPRKWKYHGL